MSLIRFAVVLLSTRVLALNTTGGACSDLHAAMLEVAGTMGNPQLTNGLGANCEGLASPHSNAMSGGYCLATLANAGWHRSSVVNPVADLVMHWQPEAGLAPVATASNSGGTQAALRLFALKGTPKSEMWNFPCYLLAANPREVCYFHNGFGRLAHVCDSTWFNTVPLASYMVFGPIMMMYGGPMGAVSSWLSTRYIFGSNLPITREQIPFQAFWQPRAGFNNRLQRPNNWIVAYSLDSPKEAGQPLYNFGWDSLVPMGKEALDLAGQPTPTPYANQSVYVASSISADMMSMMKMSPFLFAGKSWDQTSGYNVFSPALKLTGLALQFVMINKLLLSHGLVADKIACPNGVGCPAMDGSLTDSSPLTQPISYSSRLSPRVRPTSYAISGPASTFSTLTYLMGQGPLKIMESTSVNTCPFTQPSICSMMSTTRELMKTMMPRAVLDQYYDLASMYGVYKPQAQVMAPFCGDPLTYDNFQGECKTTGVCNMFVNIIPSSFAKVAFTPEQMVAGITMTYLSNTPVAKRFVESYIPSRMRTLAYYRNMEDWFPDFSATAAQKGGLAFTKPAGNALLDYMTYLVERLSYKIVHAKVQSTNLYQGASPTCEHDVFKKIEQGNLPA